jgi:MFS family permease
LSLYLIMQMVGIILAQILLNMGDPSGFILFVIPSILVSIAFTPILLSAAPAPTFTNAKPMSFRRLYEASPLGCVGMFLLGGVFSAQFGMASVWGTQAGLSIKQISIFVAFIYVGGLLLQYPIGWFSDRMDRRRLVLWLAVVGAVVMFAPVVWTLLPLGPFPFVLLVIIGAMGGGISNPLYSLLVAYVNDYLDNSDMAAASAGLIFINGLGAISGPLITAWIMGLVGPDGFFLFMALLFALLAGYTAFRMTRRRRTPDAQGSYTPVSPISSGVAVEAARERQ